jgi:LDH2 family malate/lactate/ureidoglycolate dehydrogenase
MSAGYVMPIALHNAIVVAALRLRGFDEDESQATARLCAMAARHGVKTHNAIKAIHLDDLFGSKAGGCVPGAPIERLPSRYAAVLRWNANRKIGPATAFAAMEACMHLADECGVGIVTVDNAFHYLWGGGYVIDAADRGYIAYTCCTAALAEVVPHGGRFPTLGTNPHSWAFPTREVLGFNICVDWATSTVAMGRVQQLAREGKTLPPGCGVDEEGLETTDPTRLRSLLPFGQHKGYGLALIDELYAAFTGGSLPTLRSRWNLGLPGEKHTSSFFFQCIRPDALDCGQFARGRTREENVRAVIDDILGHGNEACFLPGQPEAQAAQRSDDAGGLLFTRAEVNSFAAIAAEAGTAFDPDALRTIGQTP